MKACQVAPIRLAAELVGEIANMVWLSAGAESLLREPYRSSAKVAAVLGQVEIMVFGFLHLTAGRQRIRPFFSRSPEAAAIDRDRDE